MTADLWAIVHNSLDFSTPDNVMLWEACCFGFFRFLRACEFTMNGPFDPAVHLTIADLQVDSLTNLQSFKVFIKCAKTNSFWQGCFIFLGCGSTSLCCWLYQTTFTFEGQVKVSHLFIKMAVLFQGPVYLHSCNLHYR